MLQNYILLTIAIFLEVCGTLLLPASRNFSKIIPTATLIICYCGSFYLLSIVVNAIPIAIVYATWAGLGVFTVALAGYFFFQHALSWQAVLGLVFIVFGVFLVNIYATFSH